MEIIKILEDCILIDEITALDDQMFAGNKWGRDGFLDAALKDYDTLFAGVTQEGHAAAYGLLRSFDDAEVIRIATDPVMRRQGIGRSLLDAMLEEAKARKTENVFLEVRAGNEAAIGLYRAAGFVAEGIRKAYYSDPKEDAVIMRYTC